MASKKKDTKRSIVSFKDLQIAYLLDGISGVEKLVAGKKNAGSILKRALKEMTGQGRNVETLEAYVNERYGSSGRGRAMPNVGEERKYKAQQIGDGGTFLRLPLTPIGVKKGGVVKVRFEQDRVVVTKT
ncbi:MAG: hypothetical protein Q8O67_26590 [Deltaproteobacteria bacterium]|jgi:hypothetical protein|nr:hypothetical protein [Deltaproteobacteria bacterium]